MLESWLFQFFLKGNWQINTTLFSQLWKPVNQRTIFKSTFKPHFLRRESGAKVRQIFQTTKSFEDFFQKTFLRTFVLIATWEAKAGAKISHIFETTKSFRRFFFKKLFLRTFTSHQSSCRFLIAGAKVALFSYPPNFFVTFFSIKLAHFLQHPLYQRVRALRFFRAISPLIYINRYRR